LSEWAAAGFNVNDECLEIEMSQHTDGSGLISLLWALWIYLNICWWHEYLPAPEETEKERRPGFIAREMIKAVVASSDLEALVSQILQRDGGTAVEHFLDERLAAYESIVAAFDSGDRRTLRKLVSPEVYAAFSDAIEAQQEITKTVFSRIDLPEILAGLVDETHMEVSIRFAAESFKLPRNASGQSIVRIPNRRRSVDIWTFGRVLSSPDSEWLLVATEVGN
jgi:predicted lipid-binding transport protein (Tim44 family)